MLDLRPEDIIHKSYLAVSSVDDVFEKDLLFTVK
jgi:hypothetical protein